MLPFCALQVWVYGNSFKSCLVAVVVPKEDAIKAWAAAAGKSGERLGTVLYDWLAVATVTMVHTCCHPAGTPTP